MLNETAGTVTFAPLSVGDDDQVADHRDIGGATTLPWLIGGTGAFAGPRPGQSPQPRAGGNAGPTFLEYVGALPKWCTKLGDHAVEMLLGFGRRRAERLPLEQGHAPGQGGDSGLDDGEQRFRRG